jgi:hypothetical protein
MGGEQHFVLGFFVLTKKKGVPRKVSVLAGVASHFLGVRVSCGIFRRCHDCGRGATPVSDLCYSRQGAILLFPSLFFCWFLTLS